MSCDRFRWLSCCISLCAEGGLLQDLEVISTRSVGTVFAGCGDVAPGGNSD